MSATAEGLVAVLGYGTDDFEDCCQKAPSDVLRGALAILVEPDPPETPVWIVERAKWGAGFIERTLANPVAGVCEKCGSRIGFGHAFVVSRLLWGEHGPRMETSCSLCPGAFPSG